MFKLSVYSAVVWFFGEYIFIAIIIAVIIYCFSKAEPKKDPPPPPPEKDIEIVRKIANYNYNNLQDTVLILFQELRGYLPGLKEPSDTSILAKVAFDITAEHVVIYHFVIGKGNNEEPVETIQDILERLIKQYLEAKEIPLPTCEEYQAADGSCWQRLVVDKVYPLNDQYRVDLRIIDCEQEVTYQKAKNRASRKNDTVAATPRDPDLD